MGSKRVMDKEEGITALKELGLSSIEIERLIRMEMKRRENIKTTHDKLKAVEIVRKMVL